MDIFFEEYDYKATRQWLANNENSLLKATAAYLITIWLLKRVMHNYKPFNLQKPLAIWNAILAIFSMLGVILSTPTYLKVIREKGFEYIYTNISDIQRDARSGYWIFLWIASKVPEFLDTVFIVLRKKPLMFIHWYHHALTGWFAFVAFQEENAFIVCTAWLNYFVHSFMYSYYCVRAMNFKVPTQFAQFITGIQIVQITILHLICARLYYLVVFGSEPVALSFRSFIISFITGVTYLALWLRLYYISYIHKGGRKYQKKESTL